jgi:hypothetical protein
MKKEPLKIKGTIEYEITVGDSHLDVKHNSTVDNDLAVLAISQYLCEIAAVGLRDNKQQVTGKQKQVISENLDRILKCRNGLSIMVALFLEGYDETKKLEFLQNNNITVEQGVLSQEEFDKMQALNEISKNVSNETEGN